MFKKILLADSLASLVDYCYSDIGTLSTVMAWCGAIAYTLQIYFDFSGYSDIAIGIGNVFGFKLNENFNFPYTAKSISEFWKRWHISLTKWFTNYVYISLGGSRVKTVARHLFNLFVVWLLTGIWHGSTSNFLLWAMIYFVIQAIEKYTNIRRFLEKSVIGNIYTLFIIIVFHISHYSLFTYLLILYHP